MRILTIVGPTAAGKTSLAMDIAKRKNGEIISADSRQIYKYLNIGTNKPTPEDQTIIPFHLIDFVDPNDNYSCGQFARDATKLIREIKKRKKIPIICGGTGLYIRALFHPLHLLPESDPEIKEKMQRILKKRGVAYLYNKLQKVDKEWSRTISSQDKQRIMRGLEVYELTGIPLSKHLKEKRNNPLFIPHYIGLNLPRPELYNRINRRFDQMIQQGLIEETRNLLKQGYNPQSGALRTIGYKEIISFLKGQTTIEEAIHKAKTRTRNYAKRQITWFNKLQGMRWFNPQTSGIGQVIAQTELN